MTTIISTTVTTITISDEDPHLISQSGIIDGGVAFTGSNTEGQLYVAGTIIGDGPSGYAVNTNGLDEVIVLSTGAILATDASVSDAIALRTGANDVTVQGYVYALDTGIFVDSDDSVINVSASGVVQGGSNGNGADANLFSTAIGGGKAFTLSNAGTIIGDFNPSTGESIAILDARFTFGLDAYDLTFSGDSTVLNSGAIFGDVLMGAGSDTYDATGGGTVSGRLDLGTGNDTLIGGSAAEIASGGGAADTLLGRAGEDVLRGDGGGDLMRGGRDDDRLIGGSGNDQIYGNGDDDDLSGGANNDMLHGGTGDDTLDGGSGNDVIIGGRGDDILAGGTATDTFVFKGNFGSDVILDFAASNDEKIDLSGVLNIRNYTDLQSNHLSSSNKGAVIDAGNGNEILLAGFDAATLQAGDFIF